MRRARFKVAPNLGLVSRSTKPTVVEEKPLDPIPIVQDDSQAVKSSSEPLAVPESSPETPALVEETLHSDVELSPVECTPMSPHSAEQNPCVDKENVIAVSQEEPTSENQVATSVEDQTQSSGLAVTRYKAKNKIRPIIKDAPHRVRTFSSASESEEDASRRQTRTPLSPVKKPPAKTEDKVETVSLKTEVTNNRKRKSVEKTPLEIKKAAMRKKLSSGQIERSQLTMFDLIYYNPIDGERL